MRTIPLGIGALTVLAGFAMVAPASNADPCGGTVDVFCDAYSCHNTDTGDSSTATGPGQCGYVPNTQSTDHCTVYADVPGNFGGSDPWSPFLVGCIR